jgi:hypothetical protein
MCHRKVSYEEECMKIVPEICPLARVDISGSTINCVPVAYQVIIIIINISIMTVVIGNSLSRAWCRQ